MSARPEKKSKTNYVTVKAGPGLQFIRYHSLDIDLIKLIGLKKYKEMKINADTAEVPEKLAAAYKRYLEVVE